MKALTLCVFVSAGVGLGTSSGGNLFREFWPDMERRFGTY